MSKKNDNYITLTEMADGFSEYNLPQTSYFSKKKDLSVFLDDGNELKFTFIDDENLEYTVIGGEDNGVTGKSAYIATEPRENIFYLSYVHKEKILLTIILDMNKKIATVIFGLFPNDETDTLPIFKRVMNDLPAYASSVYFHNAAVDGHYENGKTETFPFTNELAGKNATYTYSNKDAYVHTYYDVDLFTWYCYSGNEAGLGDTDYVKFLKIADNLYVIIWIEKILHVISTIILDFNANQSTGSMASYEGKDYRGKILNVPSGAKIKKIEGLDVTKL
ncbi:Molybdenum cofactor biosynthesis protein F [Anaerosphaera aminiphila DSM 21120]|uniref:Molybdenum cofactor biosynthesis protein F n=1 Tax=Anaerosphaera aminiphila DSM 21120 TaxID=1120995 RepID=A0A1M5PKM2_9FIRM|nr:MoaF C-terminal domain-containing protein [Anaerosphaera aminiphila]SHH02240.1 Molybdenum cofactor biosynthesis protein F [Anaerosphaera aminiphila DSM 21120]